MPIGHYSFVRSNSSIKGFLSPNRPSTDAISALENWSNNQSQRSYTVLVDEDERLVAELSWNESDASAGSDLEEACRRFGVDRSYEQS